MHTRMSPTLRQPRNLARKGFRLIVFICICVLVGNAMSLLWSLVGEHALTQGNVHAPSVQKLSTNILHNHSLPDNRPAECKTISYVANSLPKASVVIILQKTAPIVVATITNLVHKTPAEMLHEIIIIDDVSEFTFPSDVFRKLYPKTNISVLRALWRLGTAKARNVGAKRASGDVVVFLTANTKVNRGWLEPILTAVKGNRKTVVQPVFDVIDSRTSEYRKNAGEMKATTVLTWDLGLSFVLQGRSLQNNSNPFPTPVISGECFAVDRVYFLEMGGVDTGLREGIGDNIELSIRFWLCGGNLKILPCSRVAQVPCPKEKVTTEKNLNLLYNNQRIAETWFGNYRKYFYFANDGRLTPSVVSSEIKRFGARLKCKDFGWFIRNLAPEMTVSTERKLFYGKLQNMKSGWCVGFDKYGNSNNAQIRLDMKPCLDDTSKSFVFGDDRLTFDGLCAHFDDNRYAILSPCSLVSDTQRWSYNENHQLQWESQNSGCAMHVTDPDENSDLRQTVMLMSCEHDQRQFSEWKFQYEIP